MLYMFDLGNVVIDIDFNRVMQVWSRLSGVELSAITQHFTMGEAFAQHERGEISDQQFAEVINHNLAITLNFVQFSEGWQAIFGEVRAEVVAIMTALRQQGNRVVILSNTNVLHTIHWRPAYPQISLAVDHLYLSHEIGMRKPEQTIYQHVLTEEQVLPEQVVFFDDNLDNILAARQAGVTAIHVVDRQTVPDYFTLQGITY